MAHSSNNLPTTIRAGVVLTSQIFSAFLFWSVCNPFDLHPDILNTSTTPGEGKHLIFFPNEGTRTDPFFFVGVPLFRVVLSSRSPDLNIVWGRFLDGVASPLCTPCGQLWTNTAKTALCFSVEKQPPFSCSSVRWVAGRPFRAFTAFPEFPDLPQDNAEFMDGRDALPAGLAVCCSIQRHCF